MSRSAPFPRSSGSTDAPRRPIQPEAGFKPVALPALAAAIHAVRTPPQPRRTQDWPAVLRKDAATD